MIGLIEGRVRRLSAPTACIITNAGIGYDIELTLTAFCQLTLDADVVIWTHLHVREDAQLLYGFLEPTERDVFRQLIRINGVGAKMALAMMSTMTVSELKHCVESGSEVMLVRVPGIGKKTAQRLLIELKGKFDNIESIPLAIGDTAIPNTGIGNEARTLAEVESALMSLGYRDKEAQQAIKMAQGTLPKDSEMLTTTALLKLSLQQLSSF